SDFVAIALYASQSLRYETRVYNYRIEPILPTGDRDLVQSQLAADLAFRKLERTRAAGIECTAPQGRLRMSSTCHRSRYHSGKPCTTAAPTCSKTRIVPALHPSVVC